jgi:predicted metalloprotease with PDZ domain
VRDGAQREALKSMSMAKRFTVPVVLVAVAVLIMSASFRAASPVRYHVSFPEPQHRWMQVEATFPDVGGTTLELRMSRSSPGRYSLHDFAKNVYEVHAFGSDGRELATLRPDPYGWNVSDHGGTVTITYRVYGDRVDGTYLAIDPTHAHINMPAAVMWAHGLDDRPVTIQFDQPAGLNWRAATQLHAGSSPFEFTAPNLQYLMDSPVEFGQIAMREFTVGGRRFRIALHHTGTDAEFDGFAKDVERVVREEGLIYGEFPEYEPGAYTFLADYLPWADGDGMEHRNSTVMTARGSLARDRRQLLDTVAHEFFHCWNVERIRPKGLEPFDFDRANMSGELWLAEGFTQYYGPLALQRSGLMDLASTAQTLTSLVETVTVGPGRRIRSAEQMSQMAPFIDGGRPVDRTNWAISVISYYPFGAAIAMAMDLSLRDRTDGRVSLDDFMRAMWRTHGRAGATREGYVDQPYTIADAEATLAEVSGDRAFARDFFAKYVQGHDIADYSRLLARAGFALRPQHAGRAWLGDLRLDFRDGARVASLVPPTWPIYAAGIDQDDELKQVDGQPIRADGDVAAVLGRHKPGESVTIGFVDRAGHAKTASITLADDPHVEVVPAETSSEITQAQRAFRDRWLKSRS